MGEYDTLLSFLDGLQVWARMELKRRGMQDLAMAIATIKSSIEFKTESSKGQVKKTHKDSNDDGDMEDSSKRDQPSRYKGNRKKDKTPKKISSFICNGPHQVLEYSMHGKHSAFVIEDEKQEEEGRIISTTPLSTIQVKVG